MYESYSLLDIYAEKKKKKKSFCLFLFSFNEKKKNVERNPSPQMPFDVLLSFFSICQMSVNHFNEILDEKSLM